MDQPAPETTEPTVLDKKSTSKKSMSTHPPYSRKRCRL